MSYFHIISGSPSTLSRNNFLSKGLEQRLAPYEIGLRSTHAIELQPFRAGASDRLADLINTVRDARAILLVTPVPSEDWAGCMKTLLQFLPAGALQYRPLLLIGTGGSVDELPNLERSLSRELTRLKNNHPIAGRKRINQSCLAGPGPGRGVHDDVAFGLKDVAQS